MTLIADPDQYTNTRIVFEFYALIDRVVAHLLGMAASKVQVCCRADAAVSESRGNSR